MHAETLDTKNQRMGDFKEAMNLAEFKSGKAQQPLPPCFVDHESEIEEFQKSCHSMMLRILVLFAIGLNIDPEAGGRDLVFLPSHWHRTQWLHPSPPPLPSHPSRIRLPAIR